MKKILQKALILAVMLFLAFEVSFSKAKIGEQKTEKGKKEIQMIVASTPGGEQISFPLAIIKGQSPGLTLGVIAGLHGGEYCGIEAAIQVYSILDPAKLKGEVRIVPIANMPGLMARVMFTVPQDGKRVSGNIPGNVNGTYTERLGALLYNKLVEPSDCVIELRGGELVETMAHYVSAPRTENEEYNAKIQKIAQIFGTRNVILRKPRKAPASPTTTGSAVSSAVALGKLAILAEAGSQGLRDKDDVDFLVNGILNVAGYLNIIERKPAPVVEKFLYLEAFMDIVSPVEGVFDCKVKADEMVKKGSLLGVVRDYGGNIIAEILAPEDGVILGVVTAAGVTKGATVIGLGR